MSPHCAEEFPNVPKPIPVGHLARPSIQESICIRWTEAEAFLRYVAAAAPP